MLDTRDIPKVRDCPFCGDSPSFLTLTDYSTQWVVKCKSLDCMVKPATGPAVSAAIPALTLVTTRIAAPQPSEAPHD